MRRLPFLFLIPVVAMLAVAAGCGDRLGSTAGDEWQLPVDTAGRLIEDAEAVTDAGRRTAIPVEPLPSPADEGLEIVRSLLVLDGTVFVLDLVGDRAVKVFASDGEAVGSWGERGPAPGQLLGPSTLFAVGEHIGIMDPAADRLSIWTRDGTHLVDFASPAFRDVIAAEALTEDRMVARVALEQQLQRQETLSVFSMEGNELARIALLPSRAPDQDRLHPRPDFAVGTDRVFVSTSAAYQVHAYDFSGAQQWAMRLAWPRAPVTDEAIGRSMERTRRAGRAMGENVRGGTDVTFPEYLPAVAHLATDGAGRLYVFPYVEDLENTTEFPVDVYDRDGSVILHGTLPFQGWDGSDGQDVYRLDADVVTGTSSVRRYRLELPEA